MNLLHSHRGWLTMLTCALLLVGVLAFLIVQTRSVNRDAYNEIITGGLAAAGNRTAVELRLARCRRQQKQYAEFL